MTTLYPAQTAVFLRREPIMPQDLPLNPSPPPAQQSPAWDYAGGDLDGAIRPCPWGLTTAFLRSTPQPEVTRPSFARSKIDMPREDRSPLRPRQALLRGCPQCPQRETDGDRISLCWGFKGP